MSGKSGDTVAVRLAQKICRFDKGRITKPALSQALRSIEANAVG